MLSFFCDAQLFVWLKMFFHHRLTSSVPNSNGLHSYLVLSAADADSNILSLPLKQIRTMFSELDEAEQAKFTELVSCQTLVPSL